jgi:3-hydroxyisobutyrate dehydrogenase-like beta-hydroxyacid dehydrogenase
MRVGFIGLGNMGLGMANNLLAKGADLTVHNRSQNKEDELVSGGAHRAGSVADLTAAADLVLICMATVDLSHQYLLGPDGVIENAREGQIVVDHATVDLATSRLCAEAAAEKGAFFLDAPISGGPTGAADGTLAIMVGGDEAAFRKASPELHKMGANVRYMGPSGAGTAMKLINQLLVAVNTAGAAEAFQLANSAQVDISEAAKLLEVSWGGSTMLSRSAPITADRSFANSAAPIRNLVKDIGIITSLGREAGLALPLSEAAETLINETYDIDPDYDIAGMLEALERRSE